MFPAYRGTGGWVTYIGADWGEIRIRLPLSWRTRNYVGTIYGGSIYGAVDPIYMLMLMRRLGPGYTVWDKAASIRFRRPGRETLFGKFILPTATVDEIRSAVAVTPKVDRHFTVELVDAEGTVCAVIDKTIHVSLRSGESTGR